MNSYPIVYILEVVIIECLILLLLSEYFTAANWCHKVPKIKLVIGDHGTSVSDEIDHKTKVVQNTRFFLRFFSQLILTTGGQDMPPMYHVTL